MHDDDLPKSAEDIEQLSADRQAVLSCIRVEQGSIYHAKFRATLQSLPIPPERVEIAFQQLLTDRVLEITGLSIRRIPGRR